jgi:periplasmic iron binding protein
LPPIWSCWGSLLSEAASSRADRHGRPLPPRNLELSSVDGKNMGRAVRHLISTAAIVGTIVLASAALAREYFVGGPVQKNDMEIVANYLVGVEMAPMMPNMQHGPDVIHLEADVHATADNIYGYPDGAWIAYLTIAYTLEKQGSGWQASGTLKPMTAKDGPHYADNVKMDGPGSYKVTYRFNPPEANGFYRHTD